MPRMVLKITNLHILRYLPTCWLYLLERYTIDNQRCTHTASEKHLDNALRCSMENYGSFEYQDVKDNNAVRHVQICPLYAMSQMDKLLSAFVWENNQ